MPDWKRLEGFEFPDRYYQYSTGSWSIQNTVKHVSGYASRCNSNAVAGASLGTDEEPLGDEAQAGIKASFYFRVDTLPSSGAVTICSIQNVGGHELSTVQINSSGNLLFYDHDTDTLLGTSTTALDTGTWYLIEVFAGYGIDDDGYTHVLRINRTIEVSSTTGSQGGDPLSGFNFGIITTPPNTVDFYFDDILVQCYGTQDDSNFEWPPSHYHIVRMGVDGQGSNNAWTGTYAGVDDYEYGAAHDSDSTVIYTSSENAREDVTLESASSAGIDGTLILVKPIAVAKDDGSAIVWRIGISSTATGTQSGQFLLDPVEGTYYHIGLHNAFFPSVSTTPSALDDAYIYVVHETKQVRLLTITSLDLLVMYEISVTEENVVCNII